MIALLCATLLCLAGDVVPVKPYGEPGQILRGGADGVPRWVFPRWRFTMHFYGRATVVDGWESERECREMKTRMQRHYPDAIVTDFEESP